ncbi:MAG: glycosyltransferase family 2 protein [Myxococcales bacterium]|nr:glycosyltransferase family 2 protein [Myxococcales bacterium]
MNHVLAVIPVYEHHEPVVAVVEGLLAADVPVLLVDDGSSDACRTALAELPTRYGSTRVRVLRLPANLGKGGAVMAGLREAARLGHSHALQIDADGQHDTSDVPRFLAASRSEPTAVVIGRPVFDDSVPKGRLYGRYATHVWVWINTLSLAIRDSMCGFRVYPLQAVVPLLDHVALGRRMDFDPEVLVRLHWRGVHFVNLDTQVRYPAGGISHFQMFRDNVRLSWMHTRLFFGMVVRLPLLLARRWRT